MTAIAPDDRRLLDRDAAGLQVPAPLRRPTPPEELPSHGWAVAKTVRWYQTMTQAPRERVARALYATDWVVDDRPFDECDDDVRRTYLDLADAALDVLAPLLGENHWRTYVARRDEQVERLESLLAAVREHEDELVTENARLRDVLDQIDPRILRIMNGDDVDGKETNE